MKDLDEHSKKVSDCLKEINKVIEKAKISTRSKSKNKKAIESIIKEKSKAYGLKNSNIEIIFYGLNITTKTKVKNFNQRY